MQIKTETKVGTFVVIAIVTLVYIAMHLGAFKFSLRSYDPYIIVFQNISGLAKKSDVKIAGVKVGWVDKIRLTNNGDTAEVVIMIGDRYKLYSDANIEISQEGLLGSKFISVKPGSLNGQMLTPGTSLNLVGHTPVSMDEVINSIDQVAKTIDLFFTKLMPTLESLNGLNEVVKKLDHMLEQNLNQAVNNFDHTVCEVKSIAQKINNSNGSLGKFLNEPGLYDDVKTATGKLKRATQFYDEINFVVDSHFEAMFRSCPDYCHNQSKGYLDFWANFNQRYFGLFELVWSECGGVKGRKDFLTSYYNQNNQLLTPAQIADLGCAYSVVPPVTKETIIKRDLFLYGIQAGRWFGNLAFRAGLIESYFGLALDYDIPFSSTDWNWVTTLECFDFKGQNRLCDRRPHFKWLNEVYYKDNVYLAFGIDDLISKESLNPFIGIGLSFGDC